MVGVWFMSFISVWCWSSATVAPTYRKNGVLWLAAACRECVMLFFWWLANSYKFVDMMEVPAWRQHGDSWHKYSRGNQVWCQRHDRQSEVGITFAWQSAGSNESRPVFQMCSNRTSSSTVTGHHQHCMNSCTVSDWPCTSSWMVFGPQEMKWTHQELLFLLISLPESSLAKHSAAFNVFQIQCLCSQQARKQKLSLCRYLCAPQSSVTNLFNFKYLKHWQ